MTHMGSGRISIRMSDLEVEPKSREMRCHHLSGGGGGIKIDAI
jgi:hypothetical protein